MFREVAICDFTWFPHYFYCTTIYYYYYYIDYCLRYNEPKMLRLLHKAIEYPDAKDRRSCTCGGNKKLTPDTKIIFVTGYDEYALKAYELLARLVDRRGTVCEAEK